MTEAETPIHLPKDTKFNIPPYLPDTEVTRRDMWKLYNNIAEMDAQVGAVLKQLEADGLLENTIIMFYGDHGGPLPRGKRLIYDSGLNTPMIVRYPEAQYAGTTDQQLISFIDFAPTLLSIIGEKPKTYMQGQEGKLNDIQLQWFRSQKPKEELFDCKADPFELNNLADNPAFQGKLNELGKEMDRWLADIGDTPNLDERKLVDHLWSGKNTKPKTSEPIITSENGKVSIQCKTKGASIKEIKYKYKRIVLVMSPVILLSFNNI